MFAARPLGILIVRLSAIDSPSVWLCLLPRRTTMDAELCRRARSSVSFAGPPEGGSHLLQQGTKVTKMVRVCARNIRGSKARYKTGGNLRYRRNSVKTPAGPLKTAQKPARKIRRTMQCENCRRRQVAGSLLEACCVLSTATWKGNRSGVTSPNMQMHLETEL